MIALVSFVSSLCVFFSTVIIVDLCFVVAISPRFVTVRLTVPSDCARVGTCTSVGVNVGAKLGDRSLMEIFAQSAHVLAQAGKRFPLGLNRSWQSGRLLPLSAEQQFVIDP